MHVSIPFMLSFHTFLMTDIKKTYLRIQAAIQYLRLYPRCWVAADSERWSANDSPASKLVLPPKIILGIFG